MPKYIEVSSVGVQICMFMHMQQVSVCKNGPEISMLVYVPHDFVSGCLSSCMWSCGSLVGCIKWEGEDTEKIQNAPHMGEFCFQYDLVENG